MCAFGMPQEQKATLIERATCSIIASLCAIALGAPGWDQPACDQILLLLLGHGALLLGMHNNLGVRGDALALPHSVDVPVDIWNESVWWGVRACAHTVPESQVGVLHRVCNDLAKLLLLLLRARLEEGVHIQHLPVAKQQLRARRCSSGAGV